MDLTIPAYYSSITERTRSTNFAKTHASATWTVCSLDARTTLNELGLPYGRKSKTIAPPNGPFSRRGRLHAAPLDWRLRTGQVPMTSGQ
ncbi:hypothetical protein QR97_00320 [Streptomyces sp. PBH53]|uniref:hypothetical protein n=1 Tax=Streptomyces TaxID=1883 RepID=UPI000654D926|nr:hypothetical protein QR97_00320 [Streptomyces sp. PBH53]